MKNMKKQSQFDQPMNNEQMFIEGYCLFITYLNYEHVRIKKLMIDMQYKKESVNEFIQKIKNFNSKILIVSELQSTIYVNFDCTQQVSRHVISKIHYALRDLFKCKSDCVSLNQDVIKQVKKLIPLPQFIKQLFLSNNFRFKLTKDHFKLQDTNQYENQDDILHHININQAQQDYRNKFSHIFNNTFNGSKLKMDQFKHSPTNNHTNKIADDISNIEKLSDKSDDTTKDTNGITTIKKVFQNYNNIHAPNTNYKIPLEEINNINYESDTDDENDLSMDKFFGKEKVRNNDEHFKPIAIEDIIQKMEINESMYVENDFIDVSNNSSLKNQDLVKLDEFQDLFKEFDQQKIIKKHIRDITHVIIDTGRIPQILMRDRTKVYLSNSKFDNMDILLRKIKPSKEDDQSFQKDSLHKISFLRNNNNIIGLTILCAKSIPNLTKSQIDHLNTKNNIILLAKKGMGKTTHLRSISNQLSLNNEVFVIDISNELSGTSSTTHHSLGNIRRIVPKSNDVNSVNKVIMNIQENHNPDQIIIDEIKDEQLSKNVQNMLKQVMEGGVNVVTAVTCNMDAIRLIDDCQGKLIDVQIEIKNDQVNVIDLKSSDIDQE